MLILNISKTKSITIALNVTIIFLQITYNFNTLEW